ncbi:MAG: hypothetical protein WBV22_03230 [Anaerolineaceae bacterium]
MKRCNNPSSPVFPKGVPLILLICFTGSILLLLTAGQAPRNTTQSTIVAITQSVTPDQKEAAPNLQEEIDVSNGIILAGALLIVVIISGTLHATWGLRKPPISH